MKLRTVLTPTTTEQYQGKQCRHKSDCSWQQSDLGPHEEQSDLDLYYFPSAFYSQNTNIKLIVFHNNPSKHTMLIQH